MNLSNFMVPFLKIFRLKIDLLSGLKSLMVLIILISPGTLKAQNNLLAVIKSTKGRGLQFDTTDDSSQFLAHFNKIHFNNRVETNEISRATFRLFRA